jgi:hypothetical protein
MSGNANNILVGAAQVSINGSDVGYTKGGSQVRYEPEFLDIMADQAIGVVKKNRTSERMYVKFTVLEVTLARIRQAFMMPSANLSGSTLTLGYNSACWTDQVALVLVGVSPSCGTRTFTFSNCTTFGKKEYNMKREEETMFEMEFEVLKNSSGVFGTIIDS